MNSPFPTVRVLCVLFLLIASFHTKAATCTAIASTNWTTTSTWSCGHAPTCNDVIVIPSGYTVTISESISLTGGGCTGTAIQLYGVLAMNGNASQLNLVAASTISIFSGGKLTTNVSNNSQKVVIGNGPAEWDSSDGNVSGPWIISNGSSNSTLPIELVSFTAACAEAGVGIDWQTLTETNSSFFELQTSEDAMDWTTLATLKSQGNSITKYNYHYLDQSIRKPGLVYYRLKQVDTDGSWKLFPAVDVNCGASFAPNDMKVYPNPAQTEVSIQLISKAADANAVLTCTDAFNRVVFELPLNLHEGHNTMSCELKIPKGLYLLSVKSAVLDITPQKLVVQD